MEPRQDEVVSSAIHRMNVNQLTVDLLEAELDVLRARRLEQRILVEKAAKVTTEKANLTAFLKYEKLIGVVNKSLAKLELDHDALQVKVNKLRSFLIEMG